MAFVAPSGEHERRCHAHSSRTGERCKRWGVRGTEPPVCRSHGGAIPAVKAKAEQRLAERAVRKLATALDVDPQEFSADPRAAVMDLIQRDRAMVEKFGRLVARYEGDDRLVYTARNGTQQIRAEFAAYRAERESAGRRLELLLKADVANALMARDGAANEIIDLVQTAMEVAVTNVLLRHDLDLDLAGEFRAEFQAVATAWTADHPEPEHPRAIAG